MVNNKVMDDVYKNDASKHLKVHFEADAVNYCRNSSFPSSSSSSSSSSPRSPSSPGLSLESSVVGKEDVNSSIVAKQPGQEFQGPRSPPEVSPSQPRPWSLQSGSSAQSSQVPRPAGYDPSRIPAAIFASKPPAGMDWSVASNDSLFSLHLGNNSFSRDQFSFLSNKSEEPYKSGELCKSGELFKLPGDIFKSGELTMADEFFYVPTPLPTVTEAETVEIKVHNVEKHAVESKDPDVENKSVEYESENVEKQKVESMIVNVENESVETEAPPDLTDLPGDISEGKAPRVEETWNSGASHRSDGSNHSTKSFAFPMLAGHDIERSSPAKMDSAKLRSEVHTLQEMHKQEEPETPDETPLKPTPSSPSWFSCFYCCTVCR